ncbi:hypothetical protein CARUB_v10006558mg [Capsella rubella]|uniref:F-box domain-containing protein n=1 Tax=Capsella rubella TaxID=81985 RepID=R0H0I1_9BRAS|nr:probable F-box protein At4g22165 [Capsella rubella]EOA18100.1 hypothetical protein CARUB_v10006558mg [Capsella rubella]
MEKNRNPKTWSELPLDLLTSVFERLSFVNFQRAKSVCSSWYSASRQSVPKKQIYPWLILFPKDKNNNNSSSCTLLFNPQEKDKLYKTQDHGVEFAQSVCIATYGSWLLMQDPKYHLYILNLFTGGRINLPPVESQLGMVKVERTINDWFRFSHHDYVSPYEAMSIISPVFWIDEESKDYVVVWAIEDGCVVSAKKGDTSWNQIPKTFDCCDMVYKDHKLYFLSNKDNLRVLDFSGGMENKTFKVVSFCILGSCPVQSNNLWCWYVTETKLVVTVTRKVLKVEKLWRPGSRYWSFRVYKIPSSEFYGHCEIVDSLGDEAMLLDLGITVPASDIEGFNKNSIYFGFSHERKTTNVCLFNLETQKMELLHKLDCSPLQLSRARWFLPSFTHK